MWQKLKALPPVAKVVIGLFVIAVLYGAAHRSPNPPHNYGEYPSTPQPGEKYASQGSDDDQKAQLLARYQAQHAQLVTVAQQCQVQMQEAMNQQAAAAMNGQMYTGRPACEQQMPQLVSQMALLETEIYRLQTGDTHSSVREITHIAAPDLRSSPSSGGGGDDGDCMRSTITIGKRFAGHRCTPMRAGRSTSCRRQRTTTATARRANLFRARAPTRPTMAATTRGSLRSTSWE